MWLHQESAFSQSLGVKYVVSFIGTLPIKCSMKGLSFDTRTLLTQHIIDRVGFEAKLIARSPRNSVGTLCGDTVCLGPHSRCDVVLSITLDKLTLLMVPTGKILRQHSMSNISFSYASDEEVSRSFTAFVVKEPVGGRIGVVLDCGTPEKARCVTTTLGQAFHLGYHRTRHFALLPPSTATKSNKTPTKTPTKAPAKAPMKTPTKEPAKTPTKLPLKSILKNREAKPKLPPKPASTQTSLIDFTSSGGGCTNSATNTEPPYYNDLPGKIPPKTNHEVLQRIKSAADVAKKDGQQPSTSQLTAPSSSQWNPSKKTEKEVPPWNVSIAFSNLPRVVDYTPKSELQQRAWFHGELSREKAELLVMVDGEFLVRCSSSNRGQFVLSCMVEGKVHHVLLVDKEGKIRNQDGTFFESITQLITYHQASKTPIMSDAGAHLLLEKGVGAHYTPIELKLKQNCA